MEVDSEDNERLVPDVVRLEVDSEDDENAIATRLGYRDPTTPSPYSFRTSALEFPFTESYLNLTVGSYRFECSLSYWVIFEHFFRALMFYTVFLQMGGRGVFYNGVYKCMEFFSQSVFWFMAFWAGCDIFFAYAGLGLFGGYGIFLRLKEYFCLCQILACCTFAREQTTPLGQHDKPVVIAR